MLQHVTPQRDVEAESRQATVAVGAHPDQELDPYHWTAQGAVFCKTDLSTAIGVTDEQMSKVAVDPTEIPRMRAEIRPNAPLGTLQSSTWDVCVSEREIQQNPTSG
jgi:hypothetical protein